MKNQKPLPPEWILVPVAGVLILASILWKSGHLVPADPALELQKTKTDVARLKHELAEATASLETERILSEAALHELEILRQRSKQVVREEYRPDGTLSTRVTETKTRIIRQKETQHATRSEAVRVETVYRVRTATASFDATSSETVHQKNDSRLGLGLGGFAAPSFQGVLGSKSVGTLAFASLDLLGGVSNWKPTIGAGASFEAFPRLSVGLGYFLRSDLRHGPALVVQHGF